MRTIHAIAIYILTAVICAYAVLGCDRPARSPGTAPEPAGIKQAREENRRLRREIAELRLQLDALRRDRSGPVDVPEADRIPPQQIPLP
jgi:hypothetical protein